MSIDSKRFLIVLGLACTSCLPGCLVAAAGAGVAGAVYIGGEVKASLPAAPDVVAEATESVLKEQKVHVETCEATGLDGRIEAHTALDTHIAIHIEREGDAQSRISIRVGTFGDHDLSNELLERIRQHLRESVTASVFAR